MVVFIIQMPPHPGWLDPVAGFLPIGETMTYLFWHTDSENRKAGPFPLPS